MRAAAWRGVVGAVVTGTLGLVASCNDPPPPPEPLDELVACSPDPACFGTAWLYDNLSGANDPGPLSDPQQVCAFEGLATAPSAMTFSRSSSPHVSDDASHILLVRWTDGTESCVEHVYDWEGDLVESTAYDCELPDSFFEQCAAQAEQGTFERECVDWYMWPFERFEETSEVRCGPLE